MATESVMAILDGRKSMTRRVIKPQPTKARYFQTHHPKQMPQYSKTDNYIPHPDGGWAEIEAPYGLSTCPYGQVKDKLWVKETHYLFGHWTQKGLTKTGKPRWEFRNEFEGEVLYHEEGIPAGLKTKKTERGWFKRPSIFMPRWASRIERIITLLRAEHLRDISPADAQAEGGYTVDEFIKLFLKINHLPENANPWNWVIGW